MTGAQPKVHISTNEEAGSPTQPAVMSQNQISKVTNRWLIITPLNLLWELRLRETIWQSHSCAKVSYGAEMWTKLCLITEGTLSCLCYIGWRVLLGSEPPLGRGGVQPTSPSTWTEATCLSRTSASPPGLVVFRLFSGPDTSNLCKVRMLSTPKLKLS